MKGQGGVIQHYSNISRTYDKARLGSAKGRIISNLQIEWLRRNLGNTRRMCLELGCGTGRVTQDIAERTGVLIATDASSEMIRIHKSNIKLWRMERRIERVICDASHLPFREKIFDSIVGARIFWHIPDYKGALKEAWRVAKANTSILFDFPCLWGPFSVYSKLLRMKHEVLTHFISRKTIESLFKKASQLTITGAASLPLFCTPNHLLDRETVRRLIIEFESLNHGLLRDILYSYYMVKVRK